MVLMMEKAKIRVLNDEIRVLNEEIRVSSGLNSDIDEIRVLNEEIRVSSGLNSDIDEIRVLEGGDFVNGDNVGVDRGRNLSSRGTVDGVVAEGGDLVSRNFELSVNGTGEMEMSRISGTGEFRDGGKGGNLASGDGEIVEGGKVESRNFEFGGSETGELGMAMVSGTGEFRDIEKRGNLASGDGEIVEGGKLVSRNFELRENGMGEMEMSRISGKGEFRDIGMGRNLGSGRKERSSLSTKGDLIGDGGIVEGGKVEGWNFEFGGSETGVLVKSRVSGMDKFREVEKRGNDLGENVVLGSGRKGKSSLSSKGGEGDGEIVVRDGNLKNRNFESRENEIEIFEMSRISGTGKSKEVENGENDVGGKGKSSLLSKGDFVGGNEGEGKRKGISKGEGSHINGKDEDFKIDRRRDSGVLAGKKILGFDIDGSVMKSVRAKVLDTEFEIGDMVWGKVKSHPWWPGHLYNKAFASSSVRRTRGDGHILVAFFGDSSYGWFEPDELVPYDLHYTEMSQQTTSKNFVTALEESVDEATRRSALGLSCYCRNPNNFRPTNVPGYLAVDVSFVERDIYSVSQIKKARDSFCPAEMLSFIRKLATTPTSSERKTSLDFIQNNATTLAYRSSVYEEFDPTYAEAFGVTPVRPELPPASELSRAPLSGSLVFADSRSGQKSSTKATKLMEQSKKDRYLSKRRDESGPSKKSKITRVHSSPSSSPHEDGTSVSATSGYVLQKRDQAASNNDLATSPVVDHLPILGNDVTSEDALTADRILKSVPQRSESNEAVTVETSDVRKVPDKSSSIVTPTDAGDLASSGSLLKKKKRAAKHPASELNFKKSEATEKKLKKTRKPENSRSISAMPGGVSPVDSSEIPMQVVSSVRDDTKVSNLRKDAETSLLKRKEKAAKFPASELNFENSECNNKNVKKTRKIESSRSNSAMLGGVSRVNSSERPLQVRASIRDDTEVSNTKNDVEANNSGSVVDDLKHRVEVADRASIKKRKATSSLKPLNISSRKDDSIKGDRKWGPSERQEENATKRIKKITDVKSLTTEKKAVPSVKSEEQRRKVDPPIRVEEPTYLVMKFPSGASLPSLVELKAKFSRFGSMDTSLSRVFYETNTCRVAFLFKQDANVAHRYAVGSKTAFSNVRFMLKAVAGPESQLPNPGRSLPQSRPTTQLKSILKKPFGREKLGGPSNGGSGPRPARVRFNIGEEKSNPAGEEKSNPAVSSTEGARLSSSSSSSFNSVMDVNNNRRFMSKLPLERPLFPVPQFVTPINTWTNNFHENCVGVSQVLPPPPPPPPTHGNDGIDISREMVGLLTICYQLVNGVKMTLGYMPYHEL